LGFDISAYAGIKFLFKEKNMAKGTVSNSGRSAPRGGKGGVGFTPPRPGGNKPSKTGKPSGTGRGNLQTKSGGK
jgi:hypothetical protein